jgi:sporulation-control protein
MFIYGNKRVEKGVEMMFKRLLTSIGIGNVKVDTVIPNQVFKKGNTIFGEVNIEGGIEVQKIEHIILTLIMRFEEIREDSDFSLREKQVEEILISLDERINVGEQRRIPFSLKVSESHPITTPQNETVLRTTLVIAQGVDVFDEDKIIIE